MKQSQANLIEPEPGVRIHEFESTAKINGATSEIDGRYPSEGFVRNSVCDEVVYVAGGRGTILYMDETSEDFEAGDCILVPAGKAFAWSGKFKIFMSCSPAFDESQHEIVK